MAVNLRRPILVGGVTLSLALWLLDSFQNSLEGVGEVGLLGAIALGTGLWWYKQRSSDVPVAKVSSPVNRETVEKAIAGVKQAIGQLQTEAETCEAIDRLQQQQEQLTAELDRKELRLLVTGGKAVGKTKLMQLLQANHQQFNVEKLSFTETEALLSQNNSESQVKPDRTLEDVVIFVTTGDLTSSELNILQQFVTAGVRPLVVVNKQDQYLDSQKVTILQQVRNCLTGILNKEDVVGVCAAPAPVKVRQHQADGSVQEKIEQPAGDITPLCDRLGHILSTEKETLVLATTLRTANALKAEIKTLLNQVRRDRAMPMIEQSQWIAGAAAFANPVPALDLLSTGAVTGQLVVDLGKIYQQKFSLQQGQAIATTLAEQMVKLGLVELSTQTITSILKSNAITFVAGGAVQGISAAYLTRLAGLSLVEYFQAQELTGDLSSDDNLQQLSHKIKKVFEQNQRVAFLQSFVQKAANRLMPEAKKSKITANVQV
jgi:uncharacterized protein (DUF697 family)